MYLKANLALIFLLLTSSLTMAQYSKNKDSILTVLQRNKKDDSVKVIDYAVLRNCTTRVIRILRSTTYMLA